MYKCGESWGSQLQRNKTRKLSKECSKNLTGQGRGEFHQGGKKRSTKWYFFGSVKDGCCFVNNHIFSLQLVDFLLFTVISLLLSTMLIVCYCMAVHTAFTGEEIGSFSWYSYNSFLNQNMLRVKVFTILVLILGCLEFLLCVVSIGYFVYSYRRDYGKVSADIGFQIYGRNTDTDHRCLYHLEVYISFYNTPNRIRSSRLFAQKRLRLCKRFIRYFGDAEKIQTVRSTVAFERIEPDHNTFPLHSDIFLH